MSLTLATPLDSMVIAIDTTPPLERLQGVSGRRARARIFADHSDAIWQRIRSRLAGMDLSLQTQEALGTAIITGPTEQLRALLMPGGALHDIEGIRQIANRAVSLP